MRGSWLWPLFIVLWVGSAGLCYASTQVFFTSQENVEQEIVRLIDQTRTSISMALFRFTSRPLAEALFRAQARGVHIRILLDGHESSIRPPGQLRRMEGRDGRHGIMHHKFAVFDQSRTLTGSYNWTAGAEYANYENALLLDEPQVIRAYQDEFEKLWARAKAVPGGPSDPIPVAPDYGRRWKRHSKMKRNHAKLNYRGTYHSTSRGIYYGRTNKS